jgi:predicted DCC family thiol-disulfide oxidoreductase YuxK
VIGWLRRRRDELFFADGDARDLGVVRALLAGMVLLLSFWFQRDFPLWAEARPWVWAPVLAFRGIAPGGPGEAVLTLLLWVWRGALALTAVGLFTRSSSIVAAVTGFLVLGLPQNFGKVNHNFGLVALCLIVLAVSRAGDAWSLDRLRFVARNARGPFAPDPPRLGAEYRWPLGLMQVLAVLVLWSAGVAKLRSPGAIAWITTDNLYYTIIRHFYTHRPPLGVGLWLTQWPIACKLLAAGSLFLEFFSPVVLYLRGRWRMLALAMLAGMMLGFGLVLGVLFLHFILTLVIVFVPWRALGAWVATRLPVHHFTVLFDGSCGLCRKTVAVVSALDVMGRVEIRDALAEWTELALQFPGLTQAQCLESMRVVRSDGRTYDGFEGYRALAWAIPLWWPLLPLLYLPVVPTIGQAIYSRIATSRYDAGCPVPEQAGRH